MGYEKKDAKKFKAELKTENSKLVESGRDFIARIEED